MMLRICVSPMCQWPLSAFSNNEWDGSARRRVQIQEAGLLTSRTSFCHNFPSLTKVSFSTYGRKEVSDFCEAFVGRFSSQLKHVLVQRRIPLGYHTTLACYVGSLYEILGERAVDAILQCHHLKDFSLEGRMYFQTTAWERWCLH